MADSDPKSMDELSYRYAKNMRISGWGIEGVTHHVPCMFCGAPDFQTYRVIDVEAETAKDTKCKYCGRSGRIITTTSNGGSTKIMELVQTGGDDPPEWMDPKPRRVDVQ